MGAVASNGRTGNGRVVRRQDLFGQQLTWQVAEMAASELPRCSSVSITPMVMGQLVSHASWAFGVTTRDACTPTGACGSPPYPSYSTQSTKLRRAPPLRRPASIRKFIPGDVERSARRRFHEGSRRGEGLGA